MNTKKCKAIRRHMKNNLGIDSFDVKYNTLVPTVTKNGLFSGQVELTATCGRSYYHSLKQSY